MSERPPELEPTLPRRWPVLLLLLTGCVLGPRRDDGPIRRVEFPPQVVRADATLLGLNDEELLAAGTAAFAAGELEPALLAFDQLAEAHPRSVHRERAMYEAGVVLQKLRRWEEAQDRLAGLSAPLETGLRLEASFRLAETRYHLGRFEEAATLLETIAARDDLPWTRILEAQVQAGVCRLEAGDPERGEAAFRAALDSYERAADPRAVDLYFPAQAQFFLGEIYRLHFEQTPLEGGRPVEQLAEELEYKAQLLLSAQGHYLRAIRLGHPHWAIASGGQIGLLYENLFEELEDAPIPSELTTPEQADAYRAELGRRIRVLVVKAIGFYEETLQTAERIGESNPFVERTRRNLQKLKDLLLTHGAAEEAEEGGALQRPPTPAPRPPGPQT